MSSLECFGDWFTNTYTCTHTHVHAQEWREKEGQRKRTIEDELDLLAMNLTKIFLFLHFFKADTQTNGGHYGLFMQICHFIFVTIFLSTKTEGFFFVPQNLFSCLYSQFCTFLGF